MPPVVVTQEDLAEATSRLGGGTGPVAVDAERASGYRYGQRAYLVQLRRAEAGTVLIDPIACPDLSGLDTALAGAEAAPPAALQDLPGPAGRRDRAGRRRGGPARRLAGPALPGRDRLPATTAVRHRAGGSPARLSEGSAGHAGRGGARLPPGEGPFGGGLVGTTAQGGHAPLRGARRRGARRTAGRPGHPAGRAGH